MEFLALTQESGGYLSIVEGIIVASGGVDLKLKRFGEQSDFMSRIRLRAILFDVVLC